MSDSDSDSDVPAHGMYIAQMLGVRYLDETAEVDAANEDAFKTIFTFNQYFKWGHSTYRNLLDNATAEPTFEPSQRTRGKKVEIYRHVESWKLKPIKVNPDELVDEENYGRLIFLSYKIITDPARLGGFLKKKKRRRRGTRRGTSRGTRSRTRRSTSRRSRRRRTSHRRS